MIAVIKRSSKKAKAAPISETVALFSKPERAKVFCNTQNALAAQMKSPITFSVEKVST